MVFKGFKRNLLHSCINNFINIRKRTVTSSQTTEQAENAPLSYVAVMTHLCIVFVWFVSLQC